MNAADGSSAERKLDDEAAEDDAGTNRPDPSNKSAGSAQDTSSGTRPTRPPADE